MRKSIELKQIMQEKQKALVDLLGKDGVTADAINKAKGELDAATASYNAAVALEEQEKKNFTGNPVVPTAKASPVAALNKALRGIQLTDEEKKLVKYEKLRDTAGTPGQVGATPAKGGYLLPKESASTIETFMDEQVRLKNDCDVYPTKYRSGSIPTRAHSNHKLTNYDELNNIQESDRDFGQITYDCKNYGEIIPVANELLDDVDVDLIGIIAEEFAMDAVDTENDKIIDVMDTATTEAITDYTGIKTAINTKLPVNVAKRAKIYTNQSGWDYLDQLKDKNDRPLLSEHAAEPGVYRYRGKEVVVIDNETLADDETTGIPFYVGSLKDFIKFVDRQGLLVAVSTEAGFEMNASKVRAIERFDVAKKNAKALRKLTLLISEEAETETETETETENTDVQGQG